MRVRAAIARFAASRHALALLIGCGIALRTLELLRNRSLWRDEASLALNVLQRPFAQLFGALDHDQVAPPLFLVIEKALVSALGSSELVLRAFPFAAGIASLFLFSTLARRLLEDDATRLMAVGLFVITDSLVYYSAEAKQYSGDVAACLLVWLTAWDLLRKPGARSALVYGLTGVVVLWLSHAASFVLAGTGSALGLHFWWKESRRSLLLTSGACALWMLSFCALYATVLRRQSGNAVLDAYWTPWFAPLPPTSLADLKWYVSSFFGLFTSPFGAGAKLYGLTAFSMLVGFAALAKPRGMAVLILAAPVAFTLLASGLHRYPFQGRLLTFLVPVVWLGVAAGVRHFWDILPGRSRWISALLLLMLCGHPLLNVVGLLQSPRLKQEFRPVAEHLRDHRRTGDAVYLCLAAERGIAYYAGRFGVELEPRFVGAENEFAGPEFYRELARLRGGGRTWFVFVYGDPERVEGDIAGQVVMAHLDEAGRKLDQLDAYGVRLCLYELAGR